ncbi:MAG: methionyl-tRNA formyltransferase [Christensenellales bacterium]
MKVVFFGTPEYAVPVLQAIIDSSHEVVAVVSQPDKPKGRNNKPVPTPIKELALKYGIKVFQFEHIRKDDISELLNIPADIYVTCAYGQILGDNVLYAKKFGVINLHGSLLPKYRGASPIQSALINNEKVTGVTILKSERGMDDGDILTSESLEIAEDDNAITLFDKLSKLSASMIVPMLDKFDSGEVKYIKQNSNLATKCVMFTIDMGTIDFSRPARDIVGLIKGLAMWPNVRIDIDGVYFKLFNAKISSLNIPNLHTAVNGEVLVANNKQGLHIKCGDGVIEITELLPINSKKMTAKSYLNGKTINIGSIAK